MTRGLLFCAAMALLQPVAAQNPLTEIAGASDLALNFQYVGSGIESRCGPNLFVLEHGFWKCAERSGNGTLQIVEFGKLPIGNLPFVVRAPIDGDRRLYMAAGSPYPNGYEMHAFDPVTLASTLLGHLPPGAQVGTRPLHADIEGDGIEELIVFGPPPFGDRAIAMLPGGSPQAFPVVSTLPFYPSLSGQFDNDAHSEFVAFEQGSTLRLYDGQSLQPEAYQPAGAYGGSRPFRKGDWDGDGKDEMALGDCCSVESLLLDPSASPTPQPISFPDAGQTQPLGLVNWQGPNSRDLVLWTSTRVGVFNPRTATEITSWSALPTPMFAEPGNPFSRDWEADGDEDFLYTEGVNGDIGLWMLRNPQGLQLVQRGAGNKLPVGVGNAADRKVIVVESFQRLAGTELRIRTRDIDTLTIESEFTLDVGTQWFDRFDAVDLHPQPGVEILRSQGTLRLYTTTGTLLWEQRPSPPTDIYRHVVAPDFTCTNDNCRWLLVSVSDVFGNNSRLQIIDTANGSAIWTGPPASIEIRPQALTDLDDDGVPEILYSDYGVPSNSMQLTALNGMSHAVRWVHDTPGAPLAVRRTDDGARRLAVLQSDGTLSYVDMENGATLRSIQTYPPGDGSCNGCDLRYLQQSETVGVWVIGATAFSSVYTLGRDLRFPITRIGYGVTTIRTLAPSTVIVGTTQEAVYTLRAAEDGIFADEFEVW